MNSKALIGNLKSWSRASLLVLGRSYSELWSYDYNTKVKGQGDISFMRYNRVTPADVQTAQRWWRDGRR